MGHLKGVEKSWQPKCLATATDHSVGERPYLREGIAVRKADAIRELVDLLALNTELTSPQKVLDSVMERESTRTMGIGYGLAIPHGKSLGVDHLTMAIGRCAQPIDFQAIDGKPVSIIWLLVSPPDKTGQHITTLAKISKLMMGDQFRVELNQAADAKALYDVIARREQQI